MSAMGKLVAVRTLDGVVIKGRTADFKPTSSAFHVRSDDGEMRKLETQGLKAVFFIKSVDGNSEHIEQKDFPERAAEKKVWIRFKDGEQLAGLSSALGGPTGFFFSPTDADSNLERVFVFRSAVEEVLTGPAAEQAASRYTPSLPS